MTSLPVGVRSSRYWDGASYDIRYYFAFNRGMGNVEPYHRTAEDTFLSAIAERDMHSVLPADGEHPSDFHAAPAISSHTIVHQSMSLGSSCPQNGFRDFVN